MKSQLVIDGQQKIRELLDRIKLLNTELESLVVNPDANLNIIIGSMQLDRNGEISSDLAKFLCIRISAFLEVSIRQICEDYFTRHSAAGSKLEFYAKEQWKHAKRGKSASREMIIGVLAEFDKGWANDFKNVQVPRQTDLQGAIDSIIENRNQIAHGEDSNITLTELESYFDKVVEVIEKFELYFNP
jgi:hypothetical protein